LRRRARCGLSSQHQGPQGAGRVQGAEVVILLGGFYGTFQAANWPRVTRVPLLPFYSFGGAAREVCAVESRRLDAVYGDRITKLRFDLVNRNLTEDEWRSHVGTVPYQETCPASDAAGDAGRQPPSPRP